MKGHAALCWKDFILTKGMGNVESLSMVDAEEMKTTSRTWKNVRNNV